MGHKLFIEIEGKENKDNKLCHALKSNIVIYSILVVKLLRHLETK